MRNFAVKHKNVHYVIGHMVSHYQRYLARSTYEYIVMTSDIEIMPLMTHESPLGKRIHKTTNVSKQ